MGVNIGHGDRRVIDAMHEQAQRLAYISPFMAYEVRARLGQKLAELLPGDMEKAFFTLGGAEANENAIRIARMVTGRHKILARYRSYHGATAARSPSPAIHAGGRTSRRCRASCTSSIRTTVPIALDDAATALAHLEETIELEGPDTIAAFILETVTGTNGILIPPDGYLQGVRELCDQVRDPDDRRRDHVRVRPHRRVVRGEPLGRGAGHHRVREGTDVVVRAARRGRPGAAGGGYFQDNVFWGGLTYNSHPLGGGRRPRHDRGLRGGRADRAHAQDGRRDGPPSPGAEGQASARRAVRNIGLFGALDLVKNRETMEPISPFNTTSETMANVNRSLLDNGLYTMIRWWTLMTNPPLPITEEQLAEGFEIIDQALEIADAAVEG